MKYRTKVIFIVFLLTGLIILFGGCKNKTDENNIKAFKSVNFKIEDNKYVYSTVKDNVEDMYITIAPNQQHKFSELNIWKANLQNIIGSRPQVDVYFDVTKPNFERSDVKTNAVMLPRGHGTSAAAQKSFKIKLKSGAGLWEEQKTINLNKHPTDLTRMRNKLAFDLLRLIPNISSLRTHFCHLYVRDLDLPNSTFVDYGLFTHVEQPNKNFLKSHGLCSDAYLYKPEMFEFLRYPDKIKNVDDPEYDNKQFQQVLRIKGINDHKRLIKMLDAVNDQNQNINNVISKYFDRDNYLTWMAVNILFGNVDTNSQNFYLMSPSASSKWYFLPWDFDGSLGYSSQPGRQGKYASWQMDGISNYWGVVLHKRFFKDSNNVKDLTKKIEEVNGIITPAVINEYVGKYYKQTSGIVSSLPDVKFLPYGLGPQNYNDEVKDLANSISENKKRYYEGLEKPMPVFLADPVKNGNEYVCGWSESYDFQSDYITYNYTIASDPTLKNIVFQQKDIKTASVSVPESKLPKGTYFLSIDIVDSKNNHQEAFDYYNDGVNPEYHNIKKIVIK
jgi:spore coat protein H